MRKIMWKIVFIAVSSTIVTGALIGISLTYIINNIFENNLNKSSKILYDNFDLLARLEVETALSVINKLYSMAEKGEINKDTAKALTIKIIRDMRYDKEGYYWIDTYDGTNVVLLGKDTEGQNRFETKDKKGKYLIKEIISQAKNGGGYTDYWFPKKGSDIPLPKRAYSKSFEPYQWVIGTGNYIDDIEKIISEQRKIDSEEKSDIRLKTLIVLSIVVIIVVIISIYFGKRISKPIAILTQASEEIASGKIIEDIVVKSKDETYLLANAFNVMKTEINNLVNETIKLSNAAKEGKLDYRANASDFEGSYREIIVGINGALDNLIRPLNVSAEYLDRISKGDLPPILTDDFKGDFNEIKNNLNQCIHSIKLLIDDSNQIFIHAIEGNLNYRAEVIKHNGEYRKIISGVNATMDRLVGIIDQMPIKVQITDYDNKVLYSNKYKQ